MPLFLACKLPEIYKEIPENASCLIVSAIKLACMGNICSILRKKKLIAQPTNQEIGKMD